MVFPAIAFLLVKFYTQNLMGNPYILYAIAALLNLLIMRYFYHFKLSQSAQGVILITFLIAMVLLFSGNFKIGANN